MKPTRFEILLFFIASLFSSSLAMAKGPAAVNTMSGYSYEEFKGFENDWKFVTVRYRNDTKEMRFTYANEVAYKALMSGSKDYPDGSRFGKVSVRTQNDLSFPSSQVPSGKVRHTFMVRNKKKHETTGGWGYALFDPSGKPYDGDHSEKTKACWACHQIVKDQGQVFSKPIGLPFAVSSAATWRSRLEFKSFQVAKLSAPLKNELGNAVSSIDLIQGPLKENLFFGTLDEIRPILIEKVKETGKAAGLVSENGEQFSIVYPVKNSRCSEEKGLKAFHSLPTNQKKLYRLELCIE